MLKHRAEWQNTCGILDGDLQASSPETSTELTFAGLKANVHDIKDARGMMGYGCAELAESGLRRKKRLENFGHVATSSSHTHDISSFTGRAKPCAV